MPVSNFGASIYALEKLPAAGALNSIPVAPRPPLPNPAAATPSAAYTATGRATAGVAANAGKVAPAAAAAATTGIRAGSGGIGPMPGGAGGAAVGAIIGGINAPANFRAGYAEGVARATGTGFPPPVAGFSDGLAQAAEGLIFWAPITGAVSDWLVDGAFTLLPGRSPVPVNPATLTGDAAGQTPGVLYKIGYTMVATRKFDGADFSADLSPRFGNYTGPIRLIFGKDTFNNDSIYTIDAGNRVLYIRRGIEGLDISSFKLRFERVDGQPDTAPGIVGNPNTQTTKPQPQPLNNPYKTSLPSSAPSPLADPYARYRTKPGINPLPALVVGVGTLGTAAIARAKKPITAAQANPVKPPVVPPNPTAKDNRCPCNAPLAAQLGNPAAANGAANGAILAKLQTMQKFAEKAWKASRIDKVLNAITTLTVLHNAAFLSRSAAETVGDVLSNGLAIFGIQDETGGRLGRD